MKIDLSTQKPRQQVTAAELSGLLGGQSSTGAVIMQLPLGKLMAYPNQPFRPYTEEKLERLTEDIRVNGVLSPIIVRPKGDQYEVLAGHNRWAASRRAGKATIPAIVQEVDDDTAALIMVNTNLNQRDALAPSEKAFAYRVQMEAMRRQGKRSDLTSCQLGTKSRTDEQLAERTNDSARAVQRYIRLTYLIPELLEMVDQGELTMAPAVDLSYLGLAQQQLVLELSGECDRRISMVQATQLKKAAAAGELTQEAIAEILLPRQRWNAQQEFVNQSRVYIPQTAKAEDIQAVLMLIREYFEGKERSA